MEYSVDSQEKGEVKFTERELSVLKLLITGMTNTQIGDKLGLSPHTVKAHMCSILQKMSVKDRVQAAVKAVREKIVD